MNYLELVQEVATKCSISGTPANVATDTGEMARVSHWVNESWHDIQTANANWGWMRYDFSFSTTASTQEYAVLATGATDFSRWHEDSFRIQQASLGLQDEQFFAPWDWTSFRNTYMYGVRQVSRPTVFAVRPRGQSLLLGPTPDAVYTITGEYQRKATRMVVANGSVPDMPDEYHMAIVHRARMKYAAFENAPEVMSEAVMDYDAVMSSLSNLYTEQVSTGSPLA